MDQVDLAIAPGQLIEQIAAIALGRGRGDQTRRLVGDDDVVVGEDDLGRRRRLGALDRAADVDLDHLAGADRAPGDLDPRAIDEHAAEIDDRARLAAGQSSDMARHDLVEAKPPLVGCDLELPRLPVGAVAAHVAALLAAIVVATAALLLLLAIALLPTTVTAAGWATGS